MGKRQVRIIRGKLAGKLAEIAGREVQIILSGNRIFKGTVNEFSDVSLCIRDGRRQQHVFPLAEIDELVYDLETQR